jgi:chromosome segregation protein
MLRLDRLHLAGFKSFVDPVEVRFAGGVTGIVGPNGCGKSNLSDAITWVLGEQSAKSLRGDTMEDVIFNGSEKRRPLGMAEASVVFLAPQGFPGSEEGRITISRRVFRSGESQYRLNGKLTRLKEIKDLLMDTGLGVRAYSVIEQGKIGLILSGKPQERRRLLEEAAGITRYKARKRIAEVKLEEASANLLRLDDIVSEVERNLRSLKRQAGAARRFTEKQRERKELERRVLLGRWAAIAAALAERRRELAAAQNVEADLAGALHRAEAELAGLREQVETGASALAALSRRQAELAATIEGRQEFLAGARRTLAELEARALSGAALATRLDEQIASHARALAELEQGRAQLVAEHDAAASAVNADGEALRAAERAVAESEERLEALRRDLLASLGRLDELRNRLHREQIEAERGSLRERHLRDELAARERELSELDAGLRTNGDELVARTAELASRLAELENARRGLDAALAGEGAASARLRALETELAQIGERQRWLAELAAAEDDPRDALLERLRAAGLGEPERLRARVVALSGWAESLDHFLGPVLDAILLPPESPALALAEAVLAQGRAAGTLLAALPADAARTALPVQDAAIVAALGEALGLPPELAAALPPAYLVESPADAARLAAAHPGVAFLARRRIWAQGGLLHLEGERAQPGYLARASELLELAAATARLDGEIATLRVEIEDRVADRARLAESIRRLEGDAAALREAEAVLRARGRELGERREKLLTALDALREEHGQLTRDVALQTTRGSDLGSELEHAVRQHAEREARFDAVQAEVDDLRQRREAQRADGAGRRGRLDVLAERLRSLEQQAERFARETAAARQQVQAWKDESAELASRRDVLEEQMASAEHELQEALERRAGGEEAVHAAEAALDEERQRVRSAEGAVAETRARHDGARAEVGEQRVTLAGLEHDETHLLGEIRERTGGEPPAVPGDPVADLQALEADLQRLTEQLEAIGPVNVLAATELESEDERLRFLTAQRADVVKSIESLRQTIREINLTSSARFRETFTAVNEQFAKTFVELFRGGEAEMRLMDEEDLLESGIEIVARPPGKRLQNLMLLSGGEKALTAIALLFALFRIKPSPFCILDEVDAPLDDVNTLRFVGMLRELARETQCIVITHNKLTMEVAGSLYGVTMEERGVSKLIQVELEEVHPQQAATA